MRRIPDGGASTNAIATGGEDRFNNSAIGVGFKRRSRKQTNIAGSPPVNLRWVAAVQVIDI
jgi:hypothetical protein